MKFLNKYGYDFKPGQLMQLLVICIIFPYTLSYFVYYGFVSNYSFNIYSEQGFRKQFENGIYRYRVLGKEIVLETYHKFHKKQQLNNTKKERFMAFLDPDGKKEFYRSIFVVNTLFFILTAIVFYLVLSNRKIYSLENNQVVSLTLLAVFFIAITQYVITPYDLISYFLSSLCFPLILLFLVKRHLLAYIFLIFLIILCTLSRESSAIILAVFGSLIFYFSDFNIKKINNSYLLALMGCVAAFLLVYVSLRFYYGFNDGVYQEDSVFYLKNLLQRKSQIGGLFFLCSLVIVFSYSRSLKISKLLWAFLLFCSPYLFLCMFTGIIFETRLWVPVILPAILLVNLNPEKLRMYFKRDD